jgi:hypothetical protein
MNFLQLGGAILLIAGGVGCLWSGIRIRRDWAVLLGASSLLAATALFVQAFWSQIGAVLLVWVGAALAITAMWRLQAFTRANR